MTTSEVRKRIIESNDPEWYNSIEEIFNFPYIEFTAKLKGVSAIYDFLNKQIEGWEKLGTNIPSQLIYSKTYFQAIRDNIDSFFTSYYNQQSNYLTSHWNSYVKNYINNLSQFPLVYSAPEVEFLIGVHQNNPASFVAAFNYIVNYNSFNSSDKNTFNGMLLAYEFANKDTTAITERRNAEKSSISKIRNDFQSYLSESETQIVEHLNNAKLKYEEYVALIDKFKADKELVFSEWFKQTKIDFDSFDTFSKKRIEDLSNSYDELLRLKKPAEYWKTRATDLKKEGWTSLKWLVALVVFACVVLYSLLWLTPEGMLKSFFNNDKSLALRWTIVFITLISFLAYGIRALTKVIFSSFHLARDAEERERLTYVYLAMVKDASVDKEDRHLIMQSLFSRADTGLLKDDSSPTMPVTNGIIEKSIR